MFSEPQKNIEQFHVDPGMRVADLGSGSGFYSLATSDAVGDSGTVFSIEVRKEMVEKIKNEAKATGRVNIRAIWSDFEMPGGSTLADNLVDRVLITNTLFQVEDRHAVLEEARRILRPKGKLLLIDWTDAHGGLGPHPDEVIGEEEARQLAEQVGFIFEREIKAGDHHYGMIFSANKIPQVQI